MAPSRGRIQVLFDAGEPDECVVLEIHQPSNSELSRFVWMTETEAHELLGRLADVLGAIEALRVATALSARPGGAAN